MLIDFRTYFLLISGLISNMAIKAMFVRSCKLPCLRAYQGENSWAGTIVTQYTASYVITIIRLGNARALVYFGNFFTTECMMKRRQLKKITHFFPDSIWSLKLDCFRSYVLESRYQNFLKNTKRNQLNKTLAGGLKQKCELLWSQISFHSLWILQLL